MRSLRDPARSRESKDDPRKGGLLGSGTAPGGGDEIFRAGLGRMKLVANEKIVFKGEAGQVGGSDASCPSVIAAMVGYGYLMRQCSESIVMFAGRLVHD